MFRRRLLKPFLILALVFVLAGLTALSLEANDSRRQGKVNHLILFIGDGMQLEHEIAASRYLYGREGGLSFHQLAYQGSVATWDVTTYNRYAFQAGVPPYEAAGFNPKVGYDPARGGLRPYPDQASGLDEAYFLTRPSTGA